MRKTATAVAIVLMVVFAGIAFAADKDVTFTAQKIVMKNDKNGAGLVQIIVADQKTLNGVAYNGTSLVTAFASNPEAYEGAKTLKAGDKFRAIVREGTYQGNISYTLLKVVR